MRMIEKYGEYLTRKRIGQELTIKRLSEKANVPERNLLAIETEKSKGFSLCHLSRYLKALDIRLSEVVDD